MTFNSRRVPDHVKVLILTIIYSIIPNQSQYFHRLDGGQ